MFDSLPLMTLKDTSQPDKTAIAAEAKAEILSDNISNIPQSNKAAPFWPGKEWVFKGYDAHANFVAYNRQATCKHRLHNVVVIKLNKQI